MASKLEQPENADQKKFLHFVVKVLCLLLNVPLDIFSSSKRTTLADWGRALMLIGVLIVAFSFYLDWSDNYSRRGGEAIVLALLWLCAAASFVPGLIVYVWDKRRRSSVKGN